MKIDEWIIMNWLVFKKVKDEMNKFISNMKNKTTYSILTYDNFQSKSLSKWYKVAIFKTYLACLDLLPLLPPTTGVPKCSGCVKGNWSNVSLSAKCLPDFKHSEDLRRVVISPSSKTEIKDFE